VYALNSHGLNGREEEFKHHRVKRTWGDPKEAAKVLGYDTVMTEFDSNHKHPSRKRLNYRMTHKKYRRDATDFVQSKYFNGQPYMETEMELKMARRDGGRPSFLCGANQSEVHDFNDKYSPRFAGSMAFITTN